ncbi:hypothetical protein [Weissella cibaria]|uniref:Uncharacterized protein n=1 Tax=Weissella cibaria TaxID=137591 RepID=A0A0D1K8K0_9LACO|nr:hypothetical protein [Weissella cibaria]KIU21344.1 hypothetical protein ab3b_02006 [Weissella cibaria]
MANMIEVLKMMKTHINGRNDNPNIPAPGFHPTKAPGRQLTNHAPEPGQVSPDEYSKFDKYLVPEKIEQRQYRFENGYGALITYYRPTNTYDLKQIKWIGDQNIFIDGISVDTADKIEDIIAALNEIKNKKDDELYTGASN